ncbi:MAG: hypothetical protein KJ767_03875 [Nanoarchaeota archaeon]|nr:hypothetical protein [Nanoarchaeota archaeon]
MKNLEQKLRELDTDEVKLNFLESIQKGIINPKMNWDSMPYLKRDLTREIEKELRDRRVDVPFDFSERIYSGEFRKEPLQRVYYGLRNTGEVPKEILQAIQDGFSDLGKNAGDYALMYFYAGIWDSPNIRKDWPLFDTVYSFIENGIKKIYSDYNKGVIEGEYNSEIKLPYDKAITQKYNELVKQRAKDLFSTPEKKEKPLVKIQDRLF